jgi:DNA-binding LytR/AlgR family response regulator
MKLRAVLIDDEPLAREILRDYCQLHQDLELVSEFDSILSAAKWFTSNTCDLLFLDIQMPRITGIDWLKTNPLHQQTAVVFTTAHAEFVSESYELQVRDYLLKPISYERFTKCVDRILLQRASFATETDATLLLRVDKAWIPIDKNTIKYVQGMGDYIKIFTDKQSYLTQETMKSFHEKLPQNLFFKPHKSWIINKKAITKVEGNLVFIGEVEIPISLHFKDDFLKALGL